MIYLVKGDITTFKGDAIVNAANQTLLGGGGVDGAIHRAAGPGLLMECITMGGCKTGEAKITKGHRLAAKYVIHAVGPVYNGGTRQEAEKLASCYRNSLILAKEHQLSSIAFPNISTGIYRFPKALAADIAISTVQEFLQGDYNVEVWFYCFDSENYELYRHYPGVMELR